MIATRKDVFNLDFLIAPYEKILHFTVLFLAGCIKPFYHLIQLNKII